MINSRLTVPEPSARNSGPRSPCDRHPRTRRVIRVIDFVNLNAASERHGGPANHLIKRENVTSGLTNFFVPDSVRLFARSFSVVMFPSP
jgi:hypothetical protein